MPQRICALLVLVAFIAAEVKLGASEATDLHPSSSSVRKSDINSKHKEQVIRTFEKHLLNMFGLRARPRPSRNITVSGYMWELYKKETKLNKGIHSQPGNVIRSFRSQESDDSKPHKASFKFDIQDLPKHETVWTAELVVYRRQPEGPETSIPIHRIQVFDVVRSNSSSEPILRLVDSRMVRAQTFREGWMNFDVLPALKRWLQNPSSKRHDLIVEILTNSTSSVHHHVRLKREAQESHEEWLEHQPVLVTYSRDSSTPVRRTRRSARKHRRKGRKNNCGRHALYVDFSDVGWNDWIVAPPGYDAYFCHGECPFPLADHLNSTNHAIVQTLVNSVNPAAVPRACCVPTELSPISMLYVDEYDKVVLKNYQDMVVEGCGCR